jgi:hypothetical protein
MASDDIEKFSAMTLAQLEVSLTDLEWPERSERLPRTRRALWARVSILEHDLQEMSDIRGQLCTCRDVREVLGLWMDRSIEDGRSRAADLRRFIAEAQKAASKL